jgi:hypothetical protein
MKKYIIRDWSETNPYKNDFPILEAPVTEPLPPAEPELEPATTEPPESAEQTPGTQTPMPGAGPVESEPEPEEIPEETPESEIEPAINFDEEKIDYMDLAVQSKYGEMTDKLLEMRDIPGLTPGQYKFIEDNIQVLSLARDVDFAEARKKIYKQIKDSIGQLAEPAEEQPAEEEPTESPVPEQEPESIPAPESPEQVPPKEGIDNSDLKTISEGNEELGEISGVEIYSIISEEIERYEEIKNSMIKLPSFYSMKADLYRKMICAVSNGVQIGSGGTLEDIFIPLAEGGVGVKLCTRCYTDFGNIEIGEWSVKFNDPEKYLAEEELEKLNVSGSPEEKEILRKRVVIESVADKFTDKVYIILIVSPEDGSRTEIGFNFSKLLKQGWQNGIISVEFKANIGKGQAAIDVDGQLIDLQDIIIDYIHENPDELDEEGRPVKEKIEFIRQKSGSLYVTITREEFDLFINESVEGLFHQTKHPEFDKGQLTVIQRCVPDIKEILLKQC